MNCPPELATILLKIIRTGILQARFLGWQGDAKQCAIAANHIHNLPSLLQEYADARLAYYWEVERSSYLRQGGSADLFASIWAELQQWLEQAGLIAVG